MSTRVVRRGAVLLPVLLLVLVLAVAKVGAALFGPHPATDGLMIKIRTVRAATVLVWAIRTRGQNHCIFPILKNRCIFPKLRNPTPVRSDSAFVSTFFSAFVSALGIQNLFSDTPASWTRCWCSSRTPQYRRPCSRASHVRSSMYTSTGSRPTCRPRAPRAAPVRSSFPWCCSRLDCYY